MAGCAKSGEDLYKDYLNRLSNVMDADKAAWSPAPALNAPKAGDMQQDIPTLRINLLEFWDTRHCELFTIISERNSILGRVQAPTQRWRFEARLLGAIEACLQHPHTDANLRSTLHAWQSDKNREWPLAVWNGTLATPEVRQLFHAEHTSWHPDALPGIHQTLDDLNILTGWAEHWPSLDLPDNSEFEALYKRLGQHNVVGQWHRSVQVSIAGLTAGNDRLAHGLAQGRLCPQGGPTQRSTAANNVLVQFFIGAVQPYLATLNRYGESLLPAIDNLANASGIRVEAWENYRQQLHADAERLRTLTREHVALWQAVLEPCGGVR